jgi:hypothetical protein
MILFPTLRTKRVSVTLRELTLNEAIAICRLPADRHEATTTEFLRRVADAAQAPARGYVTDPRLWTVEERARLVCHYLSQVSEAGADFPVGTAGKLSDYLQFAQDLDRAEVELGEIAGKARVMRPLLGAHVEVLERMCTQRGDWLHAVIACQIHEAGSQEPDYAQLTDVQMFEWCTSRLQALRGLPESEFEEIYAAWSRGRRDLEHFFVMAVDDEGVVFWPHDLKEAGPQTPARFHALSCISKGTRDLFSGPDQSGR